MEWFLAVLFFISFWSAVVNVWAGSLLAAFRNKDAQTLFLGAIAFGVLALVVKSL